MKVYKLTYDRGIKNYDKKGIDDLFWYDLATIKKMVKKDKSKFKEDFPIVLELLQQLI